MKLKTHLIKNASGLKRQNFNHMVDFVKQTLQANGGDYATIRQQMRALMEFMSTEACQNLNVDLTKLKQVYEYLFTNNHDIIAWWKTPSAGKALYEKFSEPTANNVSFRREVHGIEVLRNQADQKPVIHFGRSDGNYIWVEGRLLFTDQSIVFHHEQHNHTVGLSDVNVGNHAEFKFNHLKQLTQVVYRTLDAELGEFWSEDQVFNLATEHDLTQTSKPAAENQGLTK